MNLPFNKALLALALLLLLPFAAGAQTITIAPPPLPYYAQPPAPGDDYIWTPGYWAWSAAEGDYYWVPGTWVEAPIVGDLWTPGYWAYEGSGFFWHAGYWGARVGFYGGVNYGYGYGGSGYQGGHWDHRHFVRSAQGTSRGHSGSSSQVSFNGGSGGNHVRPPAQNPHSRPEEHRAPSEAQMQHEHAAVTRPMQRATGSHEQPMVAATPRPSAFEAPGAERARGAPPARQPNRPAPAARGAQAERPQQAPAHHEQEPRREH